MKISELDFLHLLPAFMRDDEAVIALSGAIDELFGDLRVDTLSTWDRIDELTDAECDDLAWELDIDWYDDSLGIAEKRETIKLAQQIKRKRGTKWAVERVLQLYLGEGGVIEWFEKEPPGTPFTFEVYTSNPNVTDETFALFKQAVEIAKNKRSHLIGISHRYMMADKYTGKNYYLYIGNSKLKADISTTTQQSKDMNFIDIATGTIYNLYFYNGKLKMDVATDLQVNDETATTQKEYNFKDFSTGDMYNIYVENGDLKMASVVSGTSVLGSSKLGEFIIA